MEWTPSQAVAEDTGRAVPGGRVPVAGGGHIGGWDPQARRNPVVADSVEVEGGFLPMPDPAVGGTRGRSAFDKAPALPPAPHRSVKTTAGVDSHFDPPAIHTAVARHPSRPQRLAAKRPARPLPNGPPGPWLERPASPRARCGVGPSVFSHPRPPASTGRSSTRNPSGKGVGRRFEAAEHAFAVHPSLGAAGVAVATVIRRRAFVARRDRAAPSPLLYVDAKRFGFATDRGTRARWPSRKGLLDRERPQAAVGLPCTSQPSAVPYEACRTRGSLPAAA